MSCFVWWSVIVCCVEMKKELSEAVRRGDLQSVTRFFELGVDIKTPCVVSL